jgi:hypothetical protein
MTDWSASSAARFESVTASAAPRSKQVTVT